MHVNIHSADNTLDVHSWPNATMQQYFAYYHVRDKMVGTHAE